MTTDFVVRKGVGDRNLKRIVTFFSHFHLVVVKRTLLMPRIEDRRVVPPMGLSVVAMRDDQGVCVLMRVKFISSILILMAAFFLCNEFLSPFFELVCGFSDGTISSCDE